MEKKPYGCLTASGLIAALLTAVIVIGVGLVRGGALFSPGPLNAQAGQPLGGVTSHADLSGKCSACHAAFWQTATMANRCVVCHTDVVAQWQDPSTLHGNLQKNNPGMTCRTCHPDHRGSGASLTNMVSADVSHEAFGYALKAHQRQTDGSPFACTTCHVTSYTRFDRSVCTTCHQQIKADFMQAHLQAYGDNCLACHDGIDTYGHAFDHSKVPFQLTGKHAQVVCGGCHTGARSIADLKATSQSCYSCHAKNDHHNGQFGTDCGACHSTNGWLPATFDHNLSAFKLTGKHTQVACTSCHANGVFTGLSTACAACHADPAFHSGLFGTNCAQCHNTSNWSSSYNGPHPGGCDGNCINHQGASCRDCHTVNLSTATCTKCHDSNTPGDGGGGGGGGGN